MSYNAGVENGRYIHGLSRTPEYNAWILMKHRCLNKRNASYKHYGGRGITIDPTWLNFMQFYNDMGPKPASYLTLERINNNQGYFKANCKWATHTRQSRNRRMTKLTKQKANQIRQLYATSQHTITDLAAQFGVSFQMISNIINWKNWK